MDSDPIIAFVASIRELLPYLAAILITIIAVTFLRTTRKVMARQEPAQPAPVGSPAISTPLMGKKPGPEVVAVITAAVAATTGHFHRVVSILRQVNLWEKVGRQSVLTSHRIR